MTVLAKTDDPGVFLTPDQIGGAPEAVQAWLRNQFFADGAPPPSFVLEQNGSLTSEDGLAICTSAEIKSLLRALAEDYLTYQVFFELGCNLYNPLTGERRPRRLRSQEFLHHTDIGDFVQLLRAIDTINDTLCRLRDDRDAVLCRFDGRNGFDVHETTQHIIYEFWRRLAKQPRASRRRPFHRRPSIARS